MPLPDTLGRLNRAAINPLVRRFAGPIPYMAVVQHAGRGSGQQYRTPVLAFRTADGFVIALVYGVDSDWVRNVLAAGSATLEHRGKLIPVSDPRQTASDGAAAHVPLSVRAVLRLLQVEHYLVLRAGSQTV